MVHVSSGDAVDHINDAGNLINGEQVDKNSVVHTI